MSEHATIDELGASLKRCMDALEGAQSAINTTRDRADGASRILANTAEGSSNDLLAGAMGVCARADAVLEEILASYAYAASLVEQYKAEKTG